MLIIELNHIQSNGGAYESLGWILLLETWNCHKQPLEMFCKKDFKKMVLKILQIKQESTFVEVTFY